MPMNSDAYLVLGLQAVLAVGIWGDKLVHRLVGGKSLESRISDCEDAALPKVNGGTSHLARIEYLEDAMRAYREAMKGTIDELHQKASDFQTEQQKSVGKIEQRLAAIDEHLKNMDRNVERLERRRGER